ncbi:hypothetical protein C0J52_08558 [Blattella germanica]|nr:hypothetical protein C0J52_08558 [Blattella germanica]
MGSPVFDQCVKNALNTLQPMFREGVPKYGIKSFDPFFAAEVSQKRGGSTINYKLRLRNVHESGSDPKNYMIKYSQFFPEKYLDGEYEIEGRVFEYPLNNKGSFNLTLYNYTQTTTAVRRPISKNGTETKFGPVKVKIVQDNIGDLKLHITNLLGGRTILEERVHIIRVYWKIDSIQACQEQLVERFGDNRHPPKNVLDGVINVGWRPFLPIVKPMIDEMVSSAFTDIFNKNFQNFPFEEMFSK